MNNYMHGRIPIPKGGKIKLNGHGLVYEILDSFNEVAAGSSCLVYHVHTENMWGTNYILKEFYPILEQGGITRHPVTHELTVDEDVKQSTEYQTRLKQFMQGVTRAKELSAIRNQEITIPYVLDGQAGDSFYLVTQYTDAGNLKENEALFRSFFGKLHHVRCIFPPFIKLQEAGFLMLDIKPDNFVDHWEMGEIFIVDTDSLYISGEEPDDFLLLSNAKYAAPEVRNLQLFSAEDAVHMAAELLTPYAVMYSIAAYLFEYFWEEPFAGGNLYDYDIEFLLDKFEKLYSRHDKTDLRKIGSNLIQILSNVLIEDLMNRITACYTDIKEFEAAIICFSLLYGRLGDSDSESLAAKEADMLITPFPEDPFDISI